MTIVARRSNWMRRIPDGQYGVVSPNKRIDMDTTEIKSRGEELIINAIDFIEKSGSFVAEQTPLVVQEFLTYRLIEASIMMAIPLLLAIFFFGFFAFFARECSKQRSSYDALPNEKKKQSYGRVSEFWEVPHLHQFTSWISFAVFCVCFIVFVIACCNKIPVIVKITVAPRVYLIEELPKLIGV